MSSVSIVLFNCRSVVQLANICKQVDISYANYGRQQQSASNQRNPELIRSVKPFMWLICIQWHPVISILFPSKESLGLRDWDLIYKHH